MPCDAFMVETLYAQRLVCMAVEHIGLYNIIQINILLNSGHLGNIKC